MVRPSNLSRLFYIATMSLCELALLGGCKAKQSALTTQTSAESPVNQERTSQTISGLQEPDHSLVFPLNFAHRTGDLAEMIKTPNIRALVVNSHTEFPSIPTSQEFRLYPHTRAEARPLT